MPRPRGLPRQLELDVCTVRFRQQRRRTSPSSSDRRRVHATPAGYSSPGSSRSGEPTRRPIRLGEQVLNTLQVDPLASDATTTIPGPDTSTTGGPPTPLVSDPSAVTTTLPPSAVGESADQLAIRNAFLGWLGTPQRDQVDEFVEDLASIRDAVRQGMAQHTPQDLAGFGGRVESVVIADPTHADVVYTVLHDGAPLYANRPGKAVKVGGTWKVTRDTECALLAVGGVTCPARTTPTP